MKSYIILFLNQIVRDAHTRTAQALILLSFFDSTLLFITDYAFNEIIKIFQTGYMTPKK